MNKKNLLVSIILILAILVAGILGYMYFKNNKTNIQNSFGGIETKLEEIKTEPVEPANNQPDPEELKPGLYVCQDQCGNGICQPAGTACKGELSCPCAETKEDCPQDCK
jgi:flagellar basal body-associated protein FliL